MKNILKVLILIIIFSYNVEAKIIKETKKVEFLRCVDGDTAHFTINGEKTVVRFIGINTPESVKTDTEVEPYGKEASNFTCNLLTNAKKVRLEYDSNSDRQDKYGRTLAYVFVDDKLIEEEILKEGLAEVKYIYGDYFYTNRLKDAEKAAKREKKNLWSDNKEEKKNKKEEKSFFKKIIDFFIELLGF